MTDDEVIDLNDCRSLTRAINGALRMAIEAHGPVTKERIGSATKRIVGAIKERNRNLRGKENPLFDQAGRAKEGGE